MNQAYALRDLVDAHVDPISFIVGLHGNGTLDVLDFNLGVRAVLDFKVFLSQQRC